MPTVHTHIHTHTHTHTHTNTHTHTHRHAKIHTSIAKCTGIIMNDCIGAAETRKTAPQEVMGAPSKVWAIAVQPTSAVFSWSKPTWTQPIIGYSYILFRRALLKQSGMVEAMQSSVIIQNLLPDASGYDFRVAAVVLDGSVGEFSSPLFVTTPKLGMCFVSIAKSRGSSNTVCERVSFC